jgi:mediator of RNA polymerase II transcription subunit 12, fungi type
MISLINQRKVTLYGARVRITPEVSTEREIRRELRMVLSELFGGTSTTKVDLPLKPSLPPVIGDEPLSYTSTAALLGHCPTFTSASRFEQVRTLKHWLLPILQSHISK